MTYKIHTLPWNECSESCGWGYQTRYSRILLEDSAQIDHHFVIILISIFFWYLKLVIFIAEKKFALTVLEILWSLVIVKQ